MPGNVNLAAHIVSAEHVIALRSFWGALDRIQRATGQYPVLPCETRPDMWFGVSEQVRAQAALECLKCPVIAECARLAEAHPQPREGVWGGRDYEQKTRRRKS